MSGDGVPTTGNDPGFVTAPAVYREAVRRLAKAANAHDADSGLRRLTEWMETDVPKTEVLPAAPLPAGQRAQSNWPVLHYGPVPRFKPERWDFQIFGETTDGSKYSWDVDAFAHLPTAEVTADLHCVTGFSVTDNTWSGVLVSTLLQMVPPADDVTHVMVWAEYGYCANLRITDLQEPTAILATHRNGEPLTPEHGHPARLIVPHLYAWKGPKWVRAFEYMVGDRRGFWEERGYHNRGEAAQGQRYSYQEDGDV